MEWKTDMSEIPIQKKCIATVKYTHGWVDFGYSFEQVPIIETRVELGWFEKWDENTVFWRRVFPDDHGEYVVVPIQAVVAWMPFPEKYEKEKKESM